MAFRWLFALLALLLATPALAGDFNVSVTATLVSDYRFRGVSFSDRDPAPQGSIDVSHSSGFYAGAWASTIAETAGANVEADAYAGWAGEAGPLRLDISAISYLYPGGDGSADVFEIDGSVSHDIGPARLRLAAAYAPGQRNLAEDNLYFSADARVGVPGTKVSATASVGRERGSFSGSKTDWSLGADYVVGPVTVGLAYVDTDARTETGRNARTGLVAKVSATF